MGVGVERERERIGEIVSACVSEDGQIHVLIRKECLCLKFMFLT